MSQNYYPASKPLQNSPMAMISLVAGILGLTLLPGVGSVIALILGYMARKEILANPESLTGKDLATAGIVLGWIGVALSILSILVIIGLIVLGVLFFIPMSVTSGYYGTSILPVLFLF